MAVVAYPAPVGGWNARDDLANMPPEDAVILRNWRPRPGYLETRAGAGSVIVSASGAYDSIGTIHTFRSTFGDVIIFSAGNLLFSYDGTNVELPFNGGTTTGATFWDAAHFQDRLIMTLGDGLTAAQVITFDGTTVSATALNITAGPDEEDIRGVQVHKGRAYYWETASQSFWYAAAGAFQGNLTEFDLGPVLRSGGALQMMLSISVDGGGGKDDLAAFVFSSGEVLLYQGDDPGDPQAWELIGSYDIGQPVDPQAHAKLAGTELVYTTDGVVDLSQAIQLGRFGESAEFTRKITNAATQAGRDYLANPGWQIVHAPGDNCVLLNIPTGSGNYRQYVRETDTGGWWECRDWNGRFTVYNDKLHMVILNIDTPAIVQCFTGTKDDYQTENDSKVIQTTALPAFNTMRQPARRKLLTVTKPFSNYGSGTFQITGKAEFDVDVPTAPATATGSTASRTQPNISTFANGHYLSYMVQTAELDQQIQWNSTTLHFEQGGPV